MIEMAGIPTMVVTRGGFKDVVAGSFAGFGFAPEAPTVFEFPVQMFLQSSDLTPINENIDKIVYGLTKWQPKVTAKGVYPAPNVTLEGKDYPDALGNLESHFLKNMWSDGLPLKPATKERVSWILTGTELAPNSVIGLGKILPRGGIATVETLAVALAMAGGRPEYMPVLVAAVEAMLEPLFAHESMNSTTMSCFPTVIVNGPMAKQIRLNSGYGLLGPDPQHPAGGAIGRALRIILQDVGGGLPGVGTMAIYGGMRYANAVFAEDEAGLPKDWPSVSVERGFAKDANVVSILNSGGVNNMNIMGKGTPPPETTMLNYLAGYVGFMGIPSSNSTHDPYIKGELKGKDPGLLLIPTGVAYQFSQQGWSKQKVKAWLAEHAVIPDTPQLRNSLENLVKEGFVKKIEDLVPLKLVNTPDDIWIVVAGGAQSGHNYWMQHGTSWAVPQSKEIKLPAKAKWDALLAQAEKDMGPVPAD